LLLGRLLDFPLLLFDHRQRKISGEKSVRLLTEKRYSPYRPSAVVRLGACGVGNRKARGYIEIGWLFSGACVVAARLGALDSGHRAAFAWAGLFKWLFNLKSVKPLRSMSLFRLQRRPDVIARVLGPGRFMALPPRPVVGVRPCSEFV